MATLESARVRYLRHAAGRYAAHLVTDHGSGYLGYIVHASKAWRGSVLIGTAAIACHGKTRQQCAESMARHKGFTTL